MLYIRYQETSERNVSKRQSKSSNRLRCYVMSHVSDDGLGFSRTITSGRRSHIFYLSFAIVQAASKSIVHGVLSMRLSQIGTRVLTAFGKV